MHKKHIKQTGNALYGLYLHHTLEVWVTCFFRGIQQPVVEGVVTKRNATELLAAIHVPSAHAHSDLLGSCVLVVVLTHTQQHPGRSYKHKRQILPKTNYRFYKRIIHVKQCHDHATNS